MMKIRIEKILNAIQSKMGYCLDSRTRFDFHSFSVMKEINEKCQYLIKRDYDCIDPEEYFNYEEQVLISKAIMRSISGSTSYVEEPFINELWDWIARIGNPATEFKFIDWDEFMEQEKNESYI